MIPSIYARRPLREVQGIPVFSASDEYTRNYETISEDHLAAVATSGQNPWIPEELWQQSEASTLALIRKYSRPGDRILDVGVGLGRVLGQLPDWDRYGMDISMAYLGAARAAGIEACYSRIEDMPYRPASFDVIVCTDVLEHVLDLTLCSRRMLSVLKPGGILVARVPNRQDLGPYTASDYPYHYVHLRNFDEHSLRLHFEKALQCEVLETAPGSYWPWSDRLRWLLPIPKWPSIIEKLLFAVRRLSPASFRRLVPYFYHPDEMNIVVRRPDGPMASDRW
jgi:SAM-dependent methyltransferase